MHTHHRRPLRQQQEGQHGEGKDGAHGKVRDAALAAARKDLWGVAGDCERVEVAGCRKHEAVRAVSQDVHSMGYRCGYDRVWTHLFPQDQAEVRITALMTLGRPSADVGQHHRITI